MIDKTGNKSEVWFFCKILRTRRKELKLSQAALAKRVCVQQSYIARVEMGEVDIQLTSLLKIAKALGLNLQFKYLQL